MGLFSTLKGIFSGNAKTVSDPSPRGILTLGVSTESSTASMRTNIVCQAIVGRGSAILSKIDWVTTLGGREVYDRPALDRLVNYRPNPISDAIAFRQQFFRSYYENHLAVAWLEYDHVSGPSKLRNIWLVDPIADHLKVSYDRKQKILAFGFEFGGKKIMASEDEMIVLPFLPSVENPYLDPKANRALEDVLRLISDNFKGLAKSIASANILRWIAKSGSPLSPESIKKRQKLLGESLATVNEDLGVWYIDGAQDLTQVQNSNVWKSVDEVAKQESHLYEYYGIPKKIVDGTASDDEYQSFVEMSVEPVAMQLGRQLTNKLLTNGEFEHGRRIELPTNDLFTASQTHRINAATTLIQSGKFYPNEIRGIMGLDLLPEDENQIIERIDRVDSGTNTPKEEPENGTE